MASSLLILVDNLGEEIYEIKCKWPNNRKSKWCRIKYKDCEYCLKSSNIKDNSIKKYCYFNKNYPKPIDENLYKAICTLMEAW